LLPTNQTPSPATSQTLLSQRYARVLAASHVATLSALGTLRRRSCNCGDQVVENYRQYRWREERRDEADQETIDIPICRS
jgi:hypothetical protein